MASSTFARRIGLPVFGMLLIALGVAPVFAQATPAAPPAQTTPAPFAGLAPELFLNARAALDAGDYDQALLNFSLFLALNPESSQAFFGQAVSLFSLQDPARALESINRALETSPESAVYRASLLNVRAQIHMALEQPDDALADRTQMVTLNPTAQTYTDRARLYVQTGQPDEALADLDSAIALSPDEASLYLFRAFVNGQLQDRASAAADYFRYINTMGQQVIPNDPLQPNEGVRVTMDEGIVHAFQFEGQAGQDVLVAAVARPGAQLDLLLVLIGPDGQPLAGDDDSGGDLNPVIAGIRLPQDGAYTVLLSHAGGGAQGEAAVIVQLAGGSPEATPEATEPAGR